MRAARSDSLRMMSQPAANGGVERLLLREPLGPGEDRGERIVQLVRDAGDRLAERGHLLGLQQLVIDVARLIVQLLAFADVAHHGLDPKLATGFVDLGAPRDFHPDDRVVGAAKPEQVVGDGAIGDQAFDERVARLRIDEPIAIERTDVRIGRLAAVAENQLEVRIGRDGRRGIGADGPDVHALLDGLEQPRERRGSLVHGLVVVTGRRRRLRRRRHRWEARRKFLLDRRRESAQPRRPTRASVETASRRRCRRRIQGRAAPIRSRRRSLRAIGRSSPCCLCVHPAGSRRSTGCSWPPPDARLRTETLP